MPSVELHIDQLRLQAEAGEARAGTLGPVLRQAFHGLAERLQQSPFGRFDEPAPLALDELRIGTLSTDELLAPGGAERLADQLYQELLRRLR